MRKIFITLLTSLFFFLNNTNAQLTVTMSSVEVEQNTQASVDITVNGFTNLLGVQFSINYDSLVLSYADATNFTGALPGLSSAAVSGPNGVGVKNGQITFSWFDQQGTGKTLPNGTRLFTLVFNGIGAKCAQTDIVTSNVPRMIEVINANLQPINLINNKGTVTIKCDGTPVDPCPNPTCANPANLTFSGAVLSSEKDQTVCVPITVKNFKMLQSGQGSISWNPAILQYTEVKTPATGGIPGFSGGFNPANVATGLFVFLWSNDNPAVPLTLPDNTVIMELCFKVIGNVGQTGCVLIGTGSLETDWANDDASVPFCLNYGKVTIINKPPQDAVTIKVGTINGVLNATVCVDVTVDNFTNILGASTTFSWNPDQLEFIRTDMYDLEGLNISAFNNTASTLKFLWIPQNAVTKPNGHKIFQICFKLKQCLPSMAVNVPGPTEIVGQGSVIIPNQTVAGSVTCTIIVEECTATCTLGSIVNVNCNGSSDGSVALTVTGTNLSNHTILWKNSSGSVVKPSAPVTSGTNLTGVGAGTYTYEVSFNSKICCSGTATVTQPAVITIPTANVVTNVICTQKGAINISATSGGNGGFAYAWTPNLGNTSNPTNLNAGTYTVTVTDSKSCTATASFTVSDQSSTITIPTTNVVTNVGCGQKGSININGTSGGNGGFIFAWTPNQGNTSNPVNLDAGSYTVTVTDSKGCSAAASFTVGNTQTELLITSGSTHVKCKGASDGSIQINATGGCPAYIYTWTGGLSGANPQNVRAGTYTVTVSDASTPAATKTVTVTVTEPASDVSISLTGTVDASTSTASDGKITLSISGGTPNYKTVWTGPTTIPDGNTSGALDANNIKAGTYSVTVTDANGCSAVRSNIEVKVGPPVVTAPKLSSSSVSSSFNGFGVTCFGSSDGSVSATLSEGSYPITVNLKSGPQTLRSIIVTAPNISFTGLVAGSYTIEALNSAGTITAGPLVITQPTKLAATNNINCSEKNKETGVIELNMNNTGTGNYSFSWFGINDLDNKVENLGKGFYNVTVTDANNCELRITNIEIKECESTGGCHIGSTVITPNGDNLNDIFIINCVLDNSSDLSVFDRWGRLVYSQSNYDNTWQGLDKDGKDLVEGGYMWVLTVNFGQGRREVYKGTVTILRAN